MRVWVDDEGWVVLDDGALLAEGGQGRVFALGRRAYKLASTPDAVLDPRKLAALATITDPHVVRPLASIREAPGGRPVGHVMARIERVVPWMQLVPKATRTRLGIDRDAALRLCERLQQVVSGLHARGIAVVDLSGANVLVDVRRREPYLIDLDSVALPGFAATAITPQITDPLAGGRFGAASDWFALAVLAFELLVGIHPFRGTHPSVVGLSARMAAGLSVLDPQVRVPPVCDDPKTLPPELLRWFAATFAGAVRTPAPWPGAPRATPGRQRGGPGRPLARSDGAPIRGVVAHSRTWWWSDAHFGHGDLVVGTTPPDAVGLLACPIPSSSGSGDGIGMLCHADDGALFLVTPEGARIDLRVQVSAVRADGGVAIVRCGDRVGLLEVHAPAGVPWASVRPLARTSPGSCVLWPGCATARQFGRLRAQALHPGARGTRDLPELDGMRLIDAAAADGVVTLLVADAHRHDRWVFGLYPPWQGLVHVERDVDPLGCALVRGADGRMWVRLAAGLAPLGPRGPEGGVLDIGHGAVFQGPSGAIRVTGDAAWPVSLPGSTTPNRQSPARAC